MDVKSSKKHEVIGRRVIEGHQRQQQRPWINPRFKAADLTKDMFDLGNEWSTLRRKMFDSKPLSI